MSDVAFIGITSGRTQEIEPLQKRALRCIIRYVKYEEACSSVVMVKISQSIKTHLYSAYTARATIGDRTFPAAAAAVWNSLPESVRASPSLQVFRSRLKTELFARSYSCFD